ncbi:hypothetical protein CapIbe_016092 [Capra ibex]
MLTADWGLVGSTVDPILLNRQTEAQRGGSPAGGQGTGDTQLTAGDPPGSASPQAAPPGEAAAWKRDSD